MLAQQAQGALTMLELPDAANLLGAATAAGLAVVPVSDVTRHADFTFPDPCADHRLATLRRAVEREVRRQRARPITRAVQRDETAIERWRVEVWPELRRQAVRECGGKGEERDCGLGWGERDNPRLRASGL